jgi:hypothetical protein
MTVSATRPLLPERVRRLGRHSLTIRACDDLWPHKKLVPALEAYPDAFILTADDDVIYSRGWVSAFVADYRDCRPALSSIAVGLGSRAPGRR